jgi:uncharacterized protein (TIGR03067 family)
MIMPAVLLFLIVAVADKPRPAPTIDVTEQKKLQGKWAVASHEFGGKKTADKEVARWSMEVNGAKLAVREDLDVIEDAAITNLNPKTKPGSVDLKITAGPDLDKVVKGIYKLEGDTLTICIAEPDRDRPTAFAAREGTGHTLFVFRKRK